LQEIQTMFIQGNNIMQWPGFNAFQVSQIVILKDCLHLLSVRLANDIVLDEDAEW
jgi:hypothetical protein